MRIILIIALIMILLLFIMYMMNNKESFTSQQIYQDSKNVFENLGNNVSYTDYKRNISYADPVIFVGSRNLWLQGKLNPENIRKAHLGY